MLGRKRSRVKGAYHYAQRRDGTRYRVYHSKGIGKYSRKSGSFRKGYTGPPGGFKRRRMNPSSVMGSSIRGFGAYSGIRGLRQGTSPPSVRNSPYGTIVRHREYIGDVPSSAAFVIAALSINPGLPGTFPWLSQVAENFEEWVPRGIIFEYKTMSSNAVVSTNANAALGTVIMATEYNVANPVFGNKQQMENYEWATSADPSRTQIHPVECSKSQNPLGTFFVRTTANPAGTDLRFYDLGLFQIASQGMQSNQTLIGELWVSYEIELRKPRILTGQPLGNEPAVDHFSLGAGANQTGLATDLSTALPATPFGTNITNLMKPSPKSNLGGRLSGGIVPLASQTDFFIPVLDGTGTPTGANGASTANTYYFPPGISSGLYMMVYTALWGVAGAAANMAPVVTNGTGVAAATVAGFNNDTLSIQNNLAATTTTTTESTFFVQVTARNCKVVMTGTAGATTPTYVDWYVCLMPVGLN